MDDTLNFLTSKKNISKISSQIKCIQTQTLENGWQQWLLKSNRNLSISPNSIIQLDEIQLAVLWQPQQTEILCLLPPVKKAITDHQWNNFSIIQKQVMVENDVDENYCLLLCSETSLAGAIHQIHLWRASKQLPKNLFVIAEIQNNAPFKLQPSRIFSSLLPAEATATIALLDDWGIVARFVNENWRPGCFQGKLGELTKFIRKKIDLKSIRQIIFK